MAITKLFLSILISLTFILMSACQSIEGTSIKIDDEPSPFQELSSSSDGVTFSLAKSTFRKSPTSIQTTIQNTTYNQCSYGDFYRIEQKVNELWYSVKYEEFIFTEFPNFIDIGLILEPKSEVEQIFSLKELNVTLTAGEYRLVKTLVCPQLEGQEMVLAKPFEIVE